MSFQIPEQYELQLKQELKDIQSVGYVLQHKKSGARVCLIENAEENKVFSIGFRTPPTDNTGVAHIVEHTSLCGSDKYPAKDPFIELAKGSLNTFLNAMTFPDKTIYPVASCNEQDFANLMSVYMDAVFHPNMYHNEKLFMQEGWHYELESKDAPLLYNGVVYNEMKGAYSAPEEVLSYTVMQQIFPDTPYSKEYGGYPAEIPTLTYEGFLSFHQRYYHPCNSYIYLYGNMDMEERLRYMDEEYLSKYDRIAIDSALPLQTPLKEIQVKDAYYSITEDEKEDHNTYFDWSRVLSASSDPLRYLAFQVLEYVLLNSSGALLTQALQDAGIGEDVNGGFNTAFRQGVFGVTVKGAEADQFTEFCNVIQATLEKTVANGIAKQTLLAGLNSLEFRTREADFGNFPAGLLYGIQALETWLHDDLAPFVHLNYGPSFEELRKLVDTDYFENLIRDELLNNTHGSNVRLMPMRGLTQKEEARVAAELAAKKASMSDEELEEVIRRTQELKKFQETPSAPEELEKIPMLSVSDIRKEITPLDYEKTSVAEVPVIYSPVSTNGIAYTDLYFSCDHIEREDIPYLVILADVLGDMDTEQYTYGELSDEILIRTGGISTQTRQFTALTEERPQLYLNVGVKALESALQDSLGLVQEMLLHTKLTDTRRLKDLVARKKARVASMINNNGDSVASIRAAAYFEQTAALSDLRSGIDFYQFVEALDKDFDSRKEALVKKLQELSAKVFVKENLLVGYTMSTLAQLQQALPNFVAALPTAGKSEPAAWDFNFTAKNEGFKTAAQIQYVARAGRFDKEQFPQVSMGAFNVLKVLMNYEYLWVNIRVLGGAYGCRAVFQPSGTMMFSSYRDPQLSKTDEVFEKLADFVEALELSDRDLTKYIIGAVSVLDRPKTPSAKGERSMTAYLCGYTNELLQQERDEVLGVTQDALRALAAPIREALSKRNFCVVGNSEKIESEKHLFAQTLQLFQ